MLEEELPVGEEESEGMLEKMLEEEDKDWKARREVVVIIREDVGGGEARGGGCR